MNHLSPSDFSLVFQQISSRRGASLLHVARDLGLSRTELRKVLDPLSKQGLLTRDGNLLRLNAPYGRVVGIDMGASHLHFALSDYNGRILREADQKIPPEEGPRKITERINEGIRSIVHAEENPPAPPIPGAKPRSSPLKRANAQTLRAVAIGVPSPVDVKRGEVSFANNLPGWREIPLGQGLEHEFRVPVFLENDANMAATGEHWRGAARHARTFVFIALGTGVGSGIFVDGRLVRGRSGAAGEVHLMNLDWQRWNEDFGDVGYFETHVSGMGIASEGRKVLNSTSSNGPSGLAGERDAMFVFEALRHGDSRARQLLENIFTILGVGVANLVAVLDPEMIVFGGGIVTGAPELLVSTVERVVKRIQEDPPKIRISELKGRAQIYGAIYSALRVAAERRLKCEG
ncbi:MAG TPA: ROK family protein [Terriglobia bacterium]|nr:ROK family protein [Terriglobia bacterium]